MKDCVSCFVPRALCAAGVVLFGFGSAWADIPANAYIQDGLIAQWDGIENAGAGQHNASATTWKDLKGEDNLTLTKVTFGENCATFASGKAIGAQKYTLENGLAFEFYAKPTEAASGDMLSFQSSSASSGFNFFGYSSQYRPYDGSKASFAKDETAGMSVVVSENGLSHSFYKNGSYVEAKSYTSCAYKDLFVSLGVLRNLTSSRTLWKGSMYSVRIYNRALTADEVAKNALVDRLRFSAVPPEGYRWNAETEKIEVRVSVALKGAGGTVSVAGGGSEVWVEPGTSVPFTVATAEGLPVVMWRGGTPTETGAGAYTIVAGGPVALTAFVGSRLCTWTGAEGDGLWATDGNWDTGSAPAAGECVLVGEGTSVTCTVQTAQLASFELAGGTLVFKEPTRCLPEDCVADLRAADVTICDSAMVKHVPEKETSNEWSTGGKGAWKLDGRVKISCVNLVVDATSTISGDGLGYYCHSKEGGTGANHMCGPTAYGTTGNGAHGGYSNYVYPDRTNISIIPCSPYDDPVHPVQAGMSGSQGDTAASPGQAGGGVIRIAATGDVLIEGTVSANSERTGGASRRAGAGGSVWISCRTIRGAGTVRANGSMNTSNANATLCGAGGCVAIHYDAAAQAELPVPDLRICAGVDFYSKTRGLSDVGTLYLTDSRFLRETYNTQRGIGGGRLILGDWDNWTPASLSLDNVWLRFPSAVCRNWHLTGGISVTGLSGRLDLGGETFFMVQRSVTPIVSEETVNVVVDGDVTLSDSGRLSVYAAATNGLAETWATLDVKGDLTLGSKTALELFSHPTNGASCRVFCNDLSIASGASLTAEGHGFGGCINGAVKVISYGPGGVSTGCGGSHGGYSYGSFPYGDVKTPLLAGSGGGWGDNYQSGGQGGGVVYVTAAGGCEINGTVSANASGRPGSSAGTGSGGSVYITAKTFTGTGSVTANGGNGQQDANAGAGGRIALVCTDAAAQKALANPAVYTFDARTYGGTLGVRVFTSDYGSLYLNDLKMASDSFAANKILHCQLYVDDWSAFEFGDIVQKDTFVRLVECPSTVCSSIFLDNAWLEFGGDGVHRTCAYKRPYRTGRGIDLAVTGDVTLTNKARFVVRGGITNGNVGVINRDVARTNSTFGARSAENAVLAGTVSVGGTLTVFTNAWVVPVSHPFDGGSVRFEVKNLDIREGGGFDASGNGWTTAQEGESAGYGPGAGSGNGKAAGYGGKTDDGKVYGYAKRPALPGSGAGRNNNNAAGGAGGGLVWLAVRKCATILGGLRADGENGSSTFGSGGSGGAIYLRTPELVCGPSAFFSADGGGANTGHADGKRGAGGRIAVYTQNGMIPATLTNISVRCGQKAYSGTPMSESGTVYFGKLPGGTMVFVR